MWRGRVGRWAIAYCLAYCEASGLEDVVLGGLGIAFVPRGGFLRARLRDSKVTPFPSFVMPTTGGSPLCTNSHRPVNN
jgi:hypothetical protein